MDSGGRTANASSAAALTDRHIEGDAMLFEIVCKSCTGLTPICLILFGWHSSAKEHYPKNQRLRSLRRTR
jgi:hypothetical protein